MIYVADSESDGLSDKMTKFHCWCFKVLDEKRFFIFCNYEELESIIEEVSGKNYRELFEEKYNATFFELNDYVKLLQSEKTTKIILHNGIGFDYPAMKKMNNIDYGIGPDFIGENKQLIVEDTLVWSRYLNPERQLPKGCPKSIPKVGGGSKKIGPHSLEAYSYLTGIAKPTVVDWSTKPLQIYVHRCCEDVLNNEATYHLLCKEKADVALSNGSKKGDWEMPLKMAKKVYHLMCEQERTGVLFDQKKAEDLVVYIDKEMKEIAERVEPILGERELPKGQQPNFPKNPWRKAFDYERPFTTTGKLKKGVIDYLSLIGLTTEKDQIEYIKNKIEEDDLSGIMKHPSLLSASAISFCNKFGITEEQEMFEEICKIERGNKGVKKLTEKLRLSHKTDTKYFLMQEFGWVPTIIKNRNILVDKKTKKNLSEEKVTAGVERYLRDMYATPMWKIICKDFGYKKEIKKPFSEAFLAKIRKQGRNLPASAQYTDQRGELCPNLGKLNAPVAKDIVKYLSLQNRRTTLKSFDKDTGWLNNKRLGVDGRLPAGHSGITPTFRKKHTCCVNVPKPKDHVLLGKEFRGLFIAPEGYTNVGGDGTSIEALVASHYTLPFDGGLYASGVIDGTFHDNNALNYSVVAGREINRDDGKNITYACLYGAQSKKISVMTSVSESRGQKIIDALWQNNPGLLAVKENIEKYWERTGKKYVMGLDGRKVYTRSKHSLMNSLFQHAGALILDFAQCFVANKIQEEGLDVQRWGEFHDESQFYESNKEIQIFTFEEKPEQIRDNLRYSKPKLDEVSNMWVQYYAPVGHLLDQGFLAAGKFFKTNVEFRAEYLCGPSWRECH